MIWVTKLLNMFRREAGIPERPAPVSGVKSVLFVLRPKMAKSFDAIRDETGIVGEDLRLVLMALEDEKRIESHCEGPADSPCRMYTRVERPK